MSLSIGVAATLSLSAGMVQPSWAVERAATGFLPLHVGGLFGFGAKEDKPSSSPTAPLDVAPAAQPVAPAPAPETPPDPLAFLNSFGLAAGEWVRVPGLEFDNFRLSDAEADGLGIRGTVGSASVLTNGTGSAFDAESLLWYFWGGGGNAYGGNEVYRLDLTTLSMALASAPSVLDSIATGAGGESCPVPSDAPSAASTFDGLVWSPLTQSFFAFPTARYCANDTLGPDAVWEFDPASALWTRVASMAGIDGPVLAEYDQATDMIVVVAGGNNATIREFDPVAGQFGSPGFLGQKISSGTAVLDRGANRLIVFSPEGVFGVSLSNLGSIQSLGALPADVDPSAGAVFDPSRGLVVLWDGGKDVRTFDPATAEWTKQTPANGPVAAAGGVYSKWIMIEQLGIFAGYQNPAQGLWLYRLPTTISGAGPTNSPPFADAGPSQRSVHTGRTVTISGTASFDIDGDTLSHSWSLVPPQGSTATLAGANSSSVTFTPDRDGVYSVRLTVSDGVLSDAATVTVTASNAAPVANAGPDASNNVGQAIQLNGTASSDPDGDALSFAWTIQSKPAGSTTLLSSTSVASPTLDLDVVGAFVLQLIVSDGLLTSAADTVTITATALAPAGGGGTPTPDTGTGTGEAGCSAGDNSWPYPQSAELCGIQWDFGSIDTRAPGSDNWPITWSDDDHQYTIWGDGGGFGGTNSTGRVSLGVARIEGTASSYTGHNVWGGVNAANPAQFPGKSYGIISIGGQLYAWLGQGGDNSLGSVAETRLIRSTDKGATWIRPATPMWTSADNLYLPSFLNYGKDNAGAGTYVYSYFPRGATFAFHKPGKADLARVPTAQILDKAAYEWFAGVDGQGNPTWTTNMAARQPVFQDPNGVRTVSVNYNAALQRYFLTNQPAAAGASGDNQLGVFVSENPWGPWKTVVYDTNWQGGSGLISFYFAPKWWSADGMGFTMVYTKSDQWATIRGQFVVPSADSGTTTPPTDGGTTTGGSVTLADVTVTGMQPAGYVWDALAVGKLVYNDRSFTYSAVPTAYQGLAVLRTANNDKGSTGSSFVTFNASAPVTVFVAHDVRIVTKPAWLSGWTATGEVLQTSDATLALYRKDFPAGAVVIGGNEGAGFSMYTVLLNTAGIDLATAGGTTTGGTTTGGTTTGSTPTAPVTGLGGSLAQVAAGLGAGQSAVLATQNINQVLQASGASGMIFGYTDNIRWNPVTRQLQYLGGDHGPPPKFVTYEEATNTWIDRGTPAHMGTAPTHGYDHLAVDPASGDFFARKMTKPDVYRWNGQGWSVLPPVTGFGYTQNIALAIEYFPELNGLLWAGLEDGTVGGAMLWDRATNAWRRVAQNLPMGSVHHVAEYNPVHKLMIFGGGNGSRNLYSLNAQGTVKTLAPAPYNVGIQSSIITVDPVGGDYLVFFSNGEFWTYNPPADQWTRQNASPPIWSNFNPIIHGVVATPVATYGVNLFVTCRNASPTDCRVTVYKHAAGGGTAPAPTPAPTVSLSASPSSVTQGEFTTLTWSFTNAASCNASDGWTGVKVAGGSQSVAPAQTTTYTLTCSGDGGSASQSVTVNVTAQPPVGGGGTVGADADFAAACAAGDVILCRTFDTLPPDTWQGNEGIFVNGFGQGCATVTGQAVCPTLDNGRLKFTYLTNSGSGDAGQYFVKFPANEVMPGQSLYVRWEQEFDSVFLNEASRAGGGFKIVQLGDAQQTSCATNEIVFNNYETRNFVQGYHGCGLFEGFTGVIPRPGFTTPDFDYQPGGTSACLASLRWGASCYTFYPNETMVFEIAVDLNANVTQPSRIRMWLTSQSRGRELVIDYSRVLVDAGLGYGAVWLQPYNTGKSSAVAHPTANSWVNNLIVARRSIP